MHRDIGLPVATDRFEFRAHRVEEESRQQALNEVGALTGLHSQYVEPREAHRDASESEYKHERLFHRSEPMVRLTGTKSQVESIQ